MNCLSHSSPNPALIKNILYLDFLIDSELFMLDIVHLDHQDVSGRERLNLWTQICFSDLTGKPDLELLSKLLTMESFTTITNELWV